MVRVRGFTLIELMIVVAIIAILAGISLLAFQDAVARAQVAEGLSLATGAKTAIAVHYSETGQFPSNNTTASLSPPGSISGRYVRSVTVLGAGRIAVLFSGTASAKIAGETLLLTAATTDGNLAWTCTGHNARYLPASCR